MKVRTAFEFSDAQLRSIRAAHGRGGAATRKESVGFIHRAVEAALKAAPTPKPKRRTVAPPTPVAPPKSSDLGPMSDEARARAQRERIRKMYRTSTIEALEDRIERREQNKA